MTTTMRPFTFSGPSSGFDPRQQRLRKERLRLEELNRESDHVKVEPLDGANGAEPERYRVTFRCRGIVNVDPMRAPVYGHQHVVLIECDECFPAEPPRLRWETPIWHPNIQHEEPKGVCINHREWLGGMDLYDLCRMLFDMAQYRNYHAERTPPFPFDDAAAQWVREYAEPNGIVNKRTRNYVDNQPFTRPTVNNPAATASARFFNTAAIRPSRIRFIR